MAFNVSRQSGGTLLGFIAGLVVGLLIATAVTLFITKSPVPFVNKVPRMFDQESGDASTLPDPNQPLYSKGAQAPAVQPVPTRPAAQSSTQPSTTPPAKAGVPVEERSRPDPGEGKPTYLQAGAFRNADDAHGMKGRLALLGLESTIATSMRDGNALYHVRMGPYRRIDELNRARQRLTENGIEATLVPVN